MPSLAKVLNFAGSILDPRAYVHILRLIHYSGYSHVRERGKLTKGKGTGIAPNVSLRNGERIAMGHDCHIGERCYLWAGDSTGRIILGPLPVALGQPGLIPALSPTGCI